MEESKIKSVKKTNCALLWTTFVQKAMNWFKTTVEQNFLHRKINVNEEEVFKR